VGRLFLFSVSCRKRNLFSLFPFHFLLSLKLFMLFQTCNFGFFALRHFLVSNWFYGRCRPRYKNIAVSTMSNAWWGCPSLNPNGFRTLLQRASFFSSFRKAVPRKEFEPNLLVKMISKAIKNIHSQTALSSYSSVSIIGYHV
jgi:hypothetical protein